MDNQGKYKGDILREFINPERIEKAPEGFTAKLMTRIQIEAGPLKVSGRLTKNKLVPFIYTVINILLVSAAFLIPGSESDSLGLPVATLLKNIKVSLPEIDFPSFFMFNLPVLLIYIFIGILSLILFDTALNIFFRREK